MPSSAGTVRIGKERLAAGLFWQPAPTAAMAAREARIVAARAELGADLLCVRRSGTPQFGLGQKRVGHRVGMRAAAASLANAVEERSWVGVFQAGEAWLYVVVRKDTVMPDGDLLFASEAEASKRLQDELVDGGWDAVFAPAEWQIPGARCDVAAELIRTGGDARLRPVARLPSMPLMVGLGLASVSLAGWNLLAPSANPPPAAVPEVPVAPPPPAPPWQGKPQTAGLMRNCQLSIEQTRTIPGYDLETASCGADGGLAVYRRHWGTLSWLSDTGRATSPDRLSVSLPRSQAVQPRDLDEQPWTAERLRRRVWGAAQDYLFDSELSEVPAAATAPGRPAGEPVAPMFRELKLSVSTKLPPTILAGVLGPIPALVVEEVVWQGNSWKVKGKAYVR